MRHVAGGLLVALVLVMTAGCYHATVETGLPPSPETVEVPWAHSFLYGLVPPSTVNVAQECPAGVSRVETQLSFVNQLANFITFGLYSPMTIMATCAQGSSNQASIEGVSFQELVADERHAGVPVHR